MAGRLVVCRVPVFPRYEYTYTCTCTVVPGSEGTAVPPRGRCPRVRINENTEALTALVYFENSCTLQHSCTLECSSTRVRTGILNYRAHGSVHIFNTRIYVYYLHAHGTVFLLFLTQNTIQGKKEIRIKVKSSVVENRHIVGLGALRHG